VIDEKTWLFATPTDGDSPFGEIDREVGGLDVEANREDKDAFDGLLGKLDSDADGVRRIRGDLGFGSAIGAPEANDGGGLRGAAWSDGVMESHEAQFRYGYASHGVPPLTMIGG
jgi:hypothetical protein